MYSKWRRNNGIEVVIKLDIFIVKCLKLLYNIFRFSLNMQNKLQEEGDKNKETILSSPLPVVEHFGLVLKRKSSYSRGLGIKGITFKSQEKSQILAEAEAAKKHANDLSSEVARLTEITKKQDEEIQGQRAAIEKQAMEMKQISAVFAHLTNTKVIPAFTPIGDPSNATISSASTSEVGRNL